MNKNIWSCQYFFFFLFFSFYIIVCLCVRVCLSYLNGYKVQYCINIKNSQMWTKLMCTSHYFFSGCVYWNLPQTLLLQVGALCKQDMNTEYMKLGKRELNLRTQSRCNRQSKPTITRVRVCRVTQYSLFRSKRRVRWWKPYPYSTEVHKLLQ